MAEPSDNTFKLGLQRRRQQPGSAVRVPPTLPFSVVTDIGLFAWLMSQPADRFRPNTSSVMNVEGSECAATGASRSA